jgi:inhibitor of KinA
MSPESLSVQFLPCGDSALSVQFGFDVDLETSTRVLRFRAAVAQSGPAGITETVPTYRSLMVHYDPLQIRQADLIGKLEPLLEAKPNVTFAARTWQFPACYDGEFAWDLEDVAKTVGLSPDQVVEMHTSIDFYVYMVGFMLGFLHMGDMPEIMAVLSRRPEPRVRLEPGAIVTAQGLTVVHNISTPGGWHVLGRTPAVLFDPRQEDRPALVAPGDTVRFVSVSRQEFDDIRARVLADDYQVPYVEAAPS